MAREPETIYRIREDGSRERVTREQFERNIQSSAMRGSRRNPQFRNTVQNFRATGSGAAG